MIVCFKINLSLHLCRPLGVQHKVVTDTDFDAVLVICIGGELFVKCLLVAELALSCEPEALSIHELWAPKHPSTHPLQPQIDIFLPMTVHREKAIN